MEIYGEKSYCDFNVLIHINQFLANALGDGFRRMSVGQKPKIIFTACEYFGHLLGRWIKAVDRLRLHDGIDFLSNGR